MGGWDYLSRMFGGSQRPLEVEVVSDAGVSVDAGDNGGVEGIHSRYDQSQIPPVDIGRRVATGFVFGLVGSLLGSKVAEAAGKFFVNDGANVIPQWTDPGMERVSRGKLSTGGGSSRGSRSGGGYGARMQGKLSDLAEAFKGIVIYPIREMRDAFLQIGDGYKNNKARGVVSAPGKLVWGVLGAANSVARQTIYTASNGGEVALNAVITGGSHPRIDRAFYWEESFFGGTLENTWGGGEFKKAAESLYSGILGAEKWRPQLFWLEHRSGKKVATIVYHDGVRMASMFLPYALAEYVVGADDRQKAIQEVVEAARKGPFKPGGR